VRHIFSGWKIALTAWALALSVCGAATAAGRTDDGAVVVLAAGVKDDGIGAGTIVGLQGTMIRVVTAKHVATFGAPSIRFDDGTVVRARIEALIPGQDLAVLDADVDAARAGTVHVAAIARPRLHAAVHVWGSGYNGPALEPAAVSNVSGELPDGPARARYALTCALCHRGDSGGGVFDQAGHLVGVFTGYFSVDSGRLSVAEIPPVMLADAPAPGGNGPKIDRSKSAATPAIVASSMTAASTTAALSAASTTIASAVARGAGFSSAIVPAAASFSR